MFKHFSILGPVENDVRFELIPWKNVRFYFISIVWVHLARKLKNFNFESHWNTLIFIEKKKIWRQIWIYPMEKCLILFRFHFLGLNLLVKLRNFDFESHWNTSFYLKKKWCQNWICLVKQRLTWFKLRCLSTDFKPYWNSLIFFHFFRVSLSCFYFWHYYRNSFELKKFLMIWRNIEILWWKFCIWRVISGCCPRTNE